MGTHIRKSGGLLLVLLLAGCSVLPFDLGGSSDDPEPDLPPTEEVLPTLTPLPTVTVEVEPIVIAPEVTPSLTPLPSPTPLGQAPDSDETVEVPTNEPPTPVTELSIFPTGQPGVPSFPGAFDIYLGAPNDQGYQLLRWVDSGNNIAVTEISVRAQDSMVVRAGHYAYFVEAGTMRPFRANNVGSVEELSFAVPPAGTGYYQIAPSGTGNFIAWLAVDGSGSSYTISHAGTDGSNARVVTQGSVPAGSTIRLVRVSNDGTRIFYDIVPTGGAGTSVFNTRYNLHMVTVSGGQDTPLVGEPACPDRLCDGHVSLDGTYLARTLPQGVSVEPIVITNVLTGQNIARFAVEGIDTLNVGYVVGYPFFTPTGELIYTVGSGAGSLTNYYIVQSDLVTGEQEIVVDVGLEPHMPLGWAGGGTWLLTTRGPAYYDTWQINFETGDMRQIASMLFLGHIEVAPGTP